MSTLPAASVYSKDNPFPARILENRLLSKPGSEKETRHFVLSLAGSGFRYKAGDSLGVYPVNPPKEVDDILRLLGATGKERVVLPRAAIRMPLRLALVANLSLDTPSRRFLELLATKLTDSSEKQRIEELLDQASKEKLNEYLSQRHTVDVLGDFQSGRPDPQEFVDQLRRLNPRLYSIASSPRTHPDEVHLTIVVVRYHMNERQRTGVCSSFLADRTREFESLVPVFLAESHFAPPEDPARDCIMVGPGTGVAPFRAFLQDRRAVGATGRNWLFFGDQRRATDFLYEEEWAEALSAGALHRIDLAWSRDQGRKTYVQDKMRENADELWAWIESGAGFYVCGDAKRMAKDVDQALHEIVVARGGLDPQAAADYVKLMKKERRYQRDVY